MCGIAGLIRLGGLTDEDTRALGEAVRILRHRGPDAESVCEESCVGLGHTRLSIIDVAGGAQPMWNEDRSIVLVFNGEIWNYRDLRAQLIAAGHAFATASDTEVLVHGYEEWGDALTERLDGMFAFALWDTRRERLLLARDPLGKKPLVLVPTDDGLAFASESRAALAAAGRRARLDAQAVPEFLFQRYVVAPRTLLEGVEKLLPGERAVYEAGRLTRTAYWRLEPAEARPLRDAELLELLEAAVERRLMSDVPLGAFLSGGVDSALVAALMRRVGASRFPTFTIGFDNPLYDERELARQTAELVGSEHHELLVRDDDLVDALPRLVRARDEPIAEPSELPLLLLAEFASRHVKVVLSGDGGDELFGGYPKYRADRILRTRMLPRGALRLAGPLLERRATHRRLGRAVEAALERDQLVRWAGWFRSFGPSDLEQLLAPALRPQATAEALSAPLRRKLAPYDGLDPTRRMLVGDLVTYLPENMLARGDRVLMAASLEGRMPLVDRTLVERVHAVPGRDRVGLRSGKRALRAAATGLIPPAVLEGGKKGFPVPIAPLLLYGRPALARGVLLSDRTLDRGLLVPDAVRRLVETGAAAGSASELQLFTILSLELWLRANVDGPDALL